MQLIINRCYESDMPGAVLRTALSVRGVHSGGRWDRRSSKAPSEAGRLSSSDAQPGRRMTAVAALTRLAKAGVPAKAVIEPTPDGCKYI